VKALMLNARGRGFESRRSRQDLGPSFQRQSRCLLNDNGLIEIPRLTLAEPLISADAPLLAMCR
jgi:hypothetical protein